jgi:hypothetical protein
VSALVASDRELASYFREMRGLDAQ